MTQTTKFNGHTYEYVDVTESLTQLELECGDNGCSHCELDTLCCDFIRMTGQNYCRYKLGAEPDEAHKRYAWRKRKHVKK